MPGRLSAGSSWAAPATSRSSRRPTSGPQAAPRPRHSSAAKPASARRGYLASSPPGRAMRARRCSGASAPTCVTPRSRCCRSQTPSSALRRAPGPRDGRPGGGEAPPELIAVGRGIAPGAGAFMPVLDVLRDMSETTPVLLALEDIHWADRSTLEFLSSLVRGLRDERLLLVVHLPQRRARTARIRCARSWPRRSAAPRRRAPRGRRAFSPGRGLAEQVGGHPRSTPRPGPGRAPSRALARATPFFAEELARGLRTPRAGPLPSSLRDVCSTCASRRWPDDARGVLPRPPGGRASGHRLLAAAIGLAARAGLAEALREAVRPARPRPGRRRRTPSATRCCRRPPTPTCCPASGRALHLALRRGPARRPDPRRRHARDGRGRARPALARARTGCPSALGAYVRAGLEAAAASSPSSRPPQHFERALEIWDLVPDAEERAGLERVEVLARAAEAAAWSGSSEHAIELVSAALELVDERHEPARAALLRERRGSYLWWDGRGADGLSAYEDAVRMMPVEPPSAERAFVLAGLGFALMLMGHFTRSRAACEEALAVARTVGARPAEVRALATLGCDVAYLGDRRAGIARLREARALGARARRSRPARADRYRPVRRAA